MKKTNYQGYKSGQISKGCQLCILGNKTVLFITGICLRGCYYCPLPESRKNKDVVYANERKLSNVNAVNEAIEEARLCSSKGLGITGGDPILVLDRVERFARAFKKAFGKSFHIHIYLPTDRLTKENLERLARAGIDEIRFHPYFLGKNIKGETEKIDWAYQLKRKYGWKVGIEIPAVPRTEKETINFLSHVKNIDFLNLNEFEMPSLDGEILLKKGMDTIGNSVAIKGSEKTALKVLNAIAKSHPRLSMHYCSASTKNLYQFKNRLKKRLKNIIKPYDIATKENNILHGTIYLESTKPMFSYEKNIEKLRGNKEVIKKLNGLRSILMNEFDIPGKLIEVDKIFLRVLTSVEIIKSVSGFVKKRGFCPAIVTEIPTYDKIILNLEWI